MGIEGGLQFQLYCQQGRVTDVNIHSTRPLKAVQIFHGKNISEMLQTLPLLFHVCGVAQASAAVAACEQAQVIMVDAATLHAREMLVWMETAREHLLRIMIDWADILAEPKPKTRIIQLQQCLPELKRGLFSNNNAFVIGAKVNVHKAEIKAQLETLKDIVDKIVFGMPAEQWLSISDESACNDWLLDKDTLASRMLRHAGDIDDESLLEAEANFLPLLTESSLHQRLNEKDAEAFIAQPLWQGQACETTAFSRQQYHPLIKQLMSTRGAGIRTRMLARLIELATIPTKLEQLFSEVCVLAKTQNVYPLVQDTGVGISQVEAARGRLIHRIELDKGIIQRYQIVAPTEWNFHPQGVAASLLKTLSAANESVLRQQADLLINTIDPCVSYNMTVH